ncbi:MAG: hypothetical protein GX434_10420 [Peptococcaceae bacterium]|nr:hypothetical protein [Peptococcaceae bacterium]
MLDYGMTFYFVFILLIVITIILRKKPILISASGLLAVGIGETASLFQGVQVVFRALLSTATDFLPIILLIGLVVGMTNMLKDTGTDWVMSRPFLKIQRAALIYWIFGIALWLLSLFLWPTPAVTLLGAVILPTLGNTRINPLGLAIGLCIFGEGMGLAGDYIIQGAPGLLAKSAGVGVEQIIRASIPLVFGSGLIAAFIGFWRFSGLNKQSPQDKPKDLGLQDKEKQEEKDEKGPGQKIRKENILALLIVFVFLTTVISLLKSGLRGDSATAVTGGITLFILILGTLFWNYKSSLNAFVKYIQEGMRFSMEVFAPIVVIAGFFILGTQEGNETILLQSGQGYLEKLSLILSGMIPLNLLTCSLIVVFAAVLGAMSGSGFSALPLVGGLAAALGHAAGLPVIPLAVLGQVAAIWTDATIIPWGFPAVVSAVTGTESAIIVRNNVLPWISALAWILVWTMCSVK